MGFDAYKGNLLPPLFAFLPSTFRHSNASPNHVDQKGMLNILKSSSTRFCLELFFLPGINEETCMQHIAEEKRSARIIMLKSKLWRKVIHTKAYRWEASRKSSLCGRVGTISRSKWAD